MKTIFIWKFNSLLLTAITVTEWVKCTVDGTHVFQRANDANAACSFDVNLKPACVFVFFLQTPSAEVCGPPSVWRAGSCSGGRQRRAAPDGHEVETSGQIIV